MGRQGELNIAVLGFRVESVRKEGRYYLTLVISLDNDNAVMTSVPLLARGSAPEFLLCIVWELVSSTCDQKRH